MYEIAYVVQFLERELFLKGGILGESVAKGMVRDDGPFGGEQWVVLNDKYMIAWEIEE